MRLRKGMVINGALTFGELKFSAMRREVKGKNEDGTENGVVERRVYDLKSRAQGKMVQVSLLANVAIKDIPKNSIVELVEPEAETYTNGSGRNMNATWYIKAKDIIVKKQSDSPKPENGKEQQPKQDFQKK